MRHWAPSSEKCAVSLGDIMSWRGQFVGRRNDGWLTTRKTKWSRTELALEDDDHTADETRRRGELAETSHASPSVQ